MKDKTIDPRVSILLFVIAILLTIAAKAQQTPVAINGQLKVCGTQLCNQYDEPIQLRGMSTHGIQWFGWGDCLTESSLDALAYDWEADILRISLYVQEGGYVTDPVGFTQQVSRLINEATERGIYALVDWHQLTPGDPNANLANARRFFTDIANEHKDKNNIIYDIANEPNGVRWDGIKRYADEMIPLIQGIDSDAVVMVGTHGYATFGVSGDGNLQDVLNNPLRFDNIMYTFHFYAASHQEAYLTRLDQASDVLPVFVTEFGSQEFTGDGPNDFAFTQRFIDLMQRKKISWTSWNYSDDFRSGAVWQTGTCSEGPWTTGQLKEAGRWIRDKIKVPADNFPTDGGGGDDDGDDGDDGGDNGTGRLIEAEAFAFQNGVQTELCTEGGLNVGYTDAGDWMAYPDINFPSTGNYRIEYRVASAVGGGTISSDLNAGNLVLGSVDIPNTGGWQNWTTVSQTVNINAGTYQFGIFSVSGGWNLNWIKITPVGNIPALLPESIGSGDASASGGLTLYPNPVSNSLQVDFEGETTGIKITDITGREVFSDPDSNGKSFVDVSDLAKGIYVLTIRRQDGTTASKQLIKK